MVVIKSEVINMDLITGITLFIAIVFGFYGSKLLAFYFGLIGGIVGFFAGFSLAFFLRYMIILLMCKLFPSHPPCRNGKCFDDDYEYIESEIESEQDEASIFRCKCGTKYIQSLSNFKEVLPDGTSKPYMRKNLIGQWIPDDIEE